MATLKTNNKAIERNSFDYARAFAETQSTNPTVVSELEQSYVLIANNLGISVFDFIQLLESKGDTAQQAVFLAAQLNSVRPRNALLGVAPNTTTPAFVSREIAA
jgi:hypothetical protein